MHPSRAYTPIDHCLISLQAWLSGDTAPQATAVPDTVTARPSPAATRPEIDLSPEERRRSARLMRVNHAGEIAAAGLYQGQALIARDLAARAQLQQSEREEHDHLVWCAQRVHELGSHTSMLEPIWHLGAVGIGTVAGLAGDRFSLGFVVETERQVITHLEHHLQQLATDDQKSRAIILQMQADEAHHAALALKRGGAEQLPQPVPLLMRFSAKIMTTISYWV